ncbi:TCEB3 [Cordylochernes scorpioides]|uniref:TCEB3 n=1 Tax=Cordylochernes scorpioides TaxID=51811 RepID=A0ABY6LJT5_9ARAC|nr:TCEB3 [Cordylochernes scorpioides]
MTIKLLQETGIGKTVKSLKKKHPGSVASYADALVTEWKKLLDRETTEGKSTEPQSNGYSSQNGSSQSKPSKSSSSHSKRASSPKPDKNQAKKPKTVSIEGFNSSTASFEDCLGFNDALSVKKKKAPPPKPSTPPPKPPREHRSPEPKKHKLSESSSQHSSKKKSSSQPSVPMDLKRAMIIMVVHMVQAMIIMPTNLAPLEKVDVLSTLPEINPHYKPLPHPDHFPALAQRKKSVLTQEEAVFFTTSRKDRTAVYSGRRHGQVGDVPSLVQYCTKYLLDNIEDLSETGGVPFSLLKPVLERCTVTQLYTLEDCNPYLLEDTDYLWEIHCRRDFKSAAPDEHETWRELYLRSYEEREAKLKALSASISANNQARAAPVRKTKVAYVEGTVKPPREVARKQAKHGTAHGGSSSSSSSSKPSISRPSTSSDPTPSSSSSSAAKKPKTAPLMQKTLRLMKNLRR